MTCDDWRGCTPAEAEALVAAEARVWLEELSWDVASAWRVVEPARAAGALPGFVVRDHGRRAVGWAAFLRHRDSLQVFAFVAERQDVADLLVDAIQSAADADRAHTIVFCVRRSSPVLERSLAVRGFLVEPYRYLSKPLVDHDGLPRGLRPWRNHTDAVSRLCARAYADADSARAFALDGTMEEWEEYIGGLVAGPGCGQFARDLSFVVPRGAGDELEAAVLVTRLGPGVIHVAQLAVDPASRGRALGTRLISAVEAAGISHGAREMTLLVAATNRPANTLYARRGFRDRAAFVVATRHQPSLSTSLALETGGESTRL